MLMPILSGLIVSIDAFFIGLSLGLQKKFRFLYLILINTFLLGLCIIGFLTAEMIYGLITFEPDLFVGGTFIFLGLWVILHYFITEHYKKGNVDKQNSIKTFLIIGLVMSVEAMFITMGITFIFLPYSNFLIPITVALAHFGYSAISFYLARTNYVKKISTTFSVIISGLALIIYGFMALFLDFGP